MAGTSPFARALPDEMSEIYTTALAEWAPARITHASAQLAAFPHSTREVVSWKSGADTRGGVGIDPKRVGVLGFSAGGNLGTVLSIHSDFVSTAAGFKEHGGLDARVSARPDFSFILYPGYLVHWPDAMTIAPEAKPTASTPPTFLLQAEDDPVHEENVLVYFQALKEAKVPAELHIFAQGGHG